MLKGIAFVVLALNLGACTDQQRLANDLSEYQIRLAAVLDIEAPEWQKVSLAPYPSIKLLNIDIPETSIQLSELYQFKDCTLATLVAERNTALGRVQYPSTRYVYEVKLIKGIQQCLLQLENTETRAALNELLEYKQKNIALVWTNLIQTSDEIGIAFSTSQGFIQGTAGDGINQTLSAIHYLNSIYTFPDVKQNEMELHLKNMREYGLPAKLWRSQLLLTSNLQKSTQWLEKNKELMLCPNGRASEKVSYLSNVFQMFFIEKIQVLASKLNHYHYTLAPAFDQLMYNKPLSPLFIALLSHYSSVEFDNYKQAMTQHIMFWQNLYKRCGLSPTG